MMEFDALGINGYTLEQLIGFYKEEGITYEDMCGAGLNWEMRETLKAAIGKIEEEKKKEEGDWQAAKRMNTISGYKFYIRKYPSGMHVFDAETKIAEIEDFLTGLTNELLADMKTNPWNYNANTMRKLFNGIEEEDRERLRRQINNDDEEEDGKKKDNLPDIATKFVWHGNTINYQLLRKHDIVPDNLSQQEICAPDYAVPQKNIAELGDFPKGRTDMYFLGVPRSGKSSVMAGLIYSLYKTGVAEYIPQLIEGKDRCEGYYKKLIQAVECKKPPVSTAEDTISFLKLNLKKDNRSNKITIVEISGEAVRDMSDKYSDNARSTWEALGAVQCLTNNNRKVLFFVLDYSIIKGGVRKDTGEWTPLTQAQTLESALRVFCTDGEGVIDEKRGFNKGCTMSKVDTVAIIVTKSDLMDENTIDGRLDRAFKYLDSNFRTFMNNLCGKCSELGINKANKYKPYVMTFSLGKFYVGNSVIYDGEDSARIANFISCATAGENEGILSGIF